MTVTPVFTGTPDRAPHTDADTRMRILSLLLRQRTMSATDIADHIALSGAAVRKHLSHLLADHLVEEAPQLKTKGRRGRPATLWQITDSGRNLFGHNYDGLATDALRALAEIGGRQAVARFARQRVRAIVAGISPATTDSEDDIAAAANDVALAFSARGYATTIQHAGRGIQICQHHCPIAAVAGEFPELCDAEADVISELVGHPVQPLATISAGNGVCTTNVPVAAGTTGSDPPRAPVESPTRPPTSFTHDDTHHPVR